MKIEIDIPGIQEITLDPKGSAHKTMEAVMEAIRHAKTQNEEDQEQAPVQRNGGTSPEEQPN